MNRLFNKKKVETSTKQINDINTKVNGRVDTLDEKIQKLDEELKRYKSQIAAAKGTAKETLKKRAIQTLKRKKMYENQRDNLAAQSFNIEQTSFAMDTAKDTLETVTAMKSAAIQLKKDHKKINIKEIENVQDNMMDLMEDMEEIQDIMGRSYTIGDNIDESELEAELENLEDEWEEEKKLNIIQNNVPSYLVSDKENTSDISKKNVKKEDELDGLELPEPPKASFAV